MTDDWIEWHGGNDDPEPAGTIVEAKFRCGAIDTDLVEDWYWGHDGESSDIIAYRVVPK